MKYIDTHCHLHDKSFKGKDLMVSDMSDKIILQMKSEGIYGITIGTDYETSIEAKSLAQDNENIFYTIGVHPCDNEKAIFDESKFEKLMSEKCVAIGECGLDYFYFKKNKDRLGDTYNIDREVDRQQRLFIQQITFANQHNLPLMLHGRPSVKDIIDNPNGMNAYEDMLYILEKTGSQMGGNVHFFVGSIEIAKRFMDLGFDFSFGGVITLTREYDDVIRYIPIERIHAETDSPYVSPKSREGKRASIPNTSLNIQIIINKISEIKNIPLAKVEEQLLINAERLYCIKSEQQ